MLVSSFVVTLRHWRWLVIVSATLVMTVSGGGAGIRMDGGDTIALVMSVGSCRDGRSMAGGEWWWW